jgi:hypothetical protein
VAENRPLFDLTEKLGVVLRCVFEFQESCGTVNDQPHAWHWRATVGDGKMIADVGGVLHLSL